MSAEVITVCPFCSDVHEMASSLIGHAVQPRDGDASLCFSCGKIAVFESSTVGGLRQPTKHEQRLMDRDIRLKLVLRDWQDMRRKDTQ